MARRALVAYIIAFGFFLSALKCWALDPYENVTFPQNWYLSVSPLYSKADRLTDKNGNTITRNLGLSTFQTLFRFTYYNQKAFKNTWAFTVIAPVGEKQLSGKKDEGIGDITAGAGYWLIDDHKAKTWLAAGAYATIPTGNYDKTKAANMGANVWKFQPAAGFAKQIGKLHLETTAKYAFYTENRDTFTRDGNELNLDGYLGYFIQPNVMLGAHLNGIWGRDKTVRGSAVPDSGIEKYQTGFSLYLLGSKSRTTIEYISDFKVKNSYKGQLFKVIVSWKL
jgi:hypothetical protein